MEKRENLLMPLGIFDPNQPPKTPAQKQQRWEMSQQYLLPRIEVSNQVTLLGAIAQAPTAYLRETDSMEMLSFCLAVKRAFFVADSVASDNVDFVYCKLYGDAAVKYKNVLSKGNLILVSGALQTRRITQKIRCTTCQSKFPVNSTVTEVLPFNIELLRQTLGQDTFKVQPQDMLPYRIGSEADTYLIQPMLREADVDAQTATSPNPQIVDPAILDEIRKEKKTW
jgi:single-stranded DNA-binding protein